MLDKRIYSDLIATHAKNYIIKGNLFIGEDIIIDPDSTLDKNYEFKPRDIIHEGDLRIDGSLEFCDKSTFTVEGNLYCGGDIKYYKGDKQVSEKDLNERLKVKGVKELNTNKLFSEEKIIWE